MHVMYFLCLNYYITLSQEQKADPQYGQGINPISRLIQIQQAKKEREPVYTVIDERGEPRQREFIMQVSEDYIFIVIEV